MHGIPALDTCNTIRQHSLRWAQAGKFRVRRRDVVDFNPVSENEEDSLPSVS